MAIDKITTAAITDGTIVTADIADANVTAAKLASGTVQNQSAFKNIIINGDMNISQRSTSVSSISSGAAYNTIDRMRFGVSSLGTWTQSQSTDVPTGQGFAKSFKLDCTTADASPGAGDYAFFNYNIEGQDVQYLKKGTSSAESVTMSFWVKSNKTGTYTFELDDKDNDRSISKTYTVDSADTWEKKTLTLPGDTTGTLDNDNNNSLRFYFWLGAGSSYTSGTLQTSWQSTTDANRVSSSNVNLADSTSNEWYVTGLQLEAGTTASDFEFLPFDINQRRCQRYYYVHASAGQALGIFWNYQSGVNNTIMYFPIMMRTTPSVTAASGSSYYRKYVNGSYADFTGFAGLQESSSHLATLDSALTGTGGQCGRVKCNNDGLIVFSAEL